MQDWDDLRYLAAAARAEGLSGAARALGTTHATVSRRITRMEEDLGTALFDRLPTGLRLTEAGARAFAAAEAVEAEILALDLALTARDARLSGPLRVTVPPLIVTDALAADFRDFRARHPDIALEVLGDNRILNLHRREADVAIRVSRTPSDTLWGRRLVDQQAAFYAAPALRDRIARALAANDRDYPLPLISFTVWKTPVPRRLAAVFPALRVVTACDDMVAAVRLGVAGMGIVRAPVFLGEGTEGLVRVEGLPVTDYSPIWLLTHPDLRRTPRVTAFMRFVGARMAARAGDYRVSGTGRAG